MASMVATCFTIQPTLHPRLAFTNSLLRNSRPLIFFHDPIPSFPACLSSKLQEPRFLLPVARAYFGSTTVIRKHSGSDFQGGRSPSWRPRANETQSDHETSSECAKNCTLQFIESIRSFMFGDGNPNMETNEERWKLIGEFITSKGGVVAAEELAPYLDPSEAKGKSDSHPLNDEAYMLPILMRYEGHPVIDEENGNVLYRFISLQPTAKELSDPNFVKKGKLIEKKFFMEKEWRFSKTSRFGKAVLVGFCGLCWKGILKLTEGLLLETPIAPGGYVKFFSTMLPLLQGFVISITMIPSLRFVLFCIIYLKRNSDIQKRNLTRQQCCRDLESPDLALGRKLQTARDMAKRLTIVMTAGEEDVPVNVFGTKMSNSSRDLVEDV